MDPVEQAVQQAVNRDELYDRVAAIERTLQQLAQEVRRATLNQGELRDRLSTAERTIHQVVTAIQNANTPTAEPEGLPIGTPGPEFALPDLDGRERTLEDFRGEPLLVIFFNTQCGYCARMAPSLGELPADGHRVLLIGQGEREDYRRLKAEHGWRCDVVIDSGPDTLLEYQAVGTPAGYLLDAEGRIASKLAIGSEALFALMTEAPAEAPAAASADASPAAAAPSEAPATQGDTLTAESLREKQQAAAERARAAGLSVGESHIKRDGLDAGTPAPDFTLPDLRGIERSLSEFRGRRVLLIFSDTNCAPCQALIPQLNEIQQKNRDDLEVVMISRGGAIANRAKAREHGIAFPVLLQRHWEISKEYAMFGTPVAYLIDEQGVIAKDVAIGSDAILKLV